MLINHVLCGAELIDPTLTNPGQNELLKYIFFQIKLSHFKPFPFPLLGGLTSLKLLFT